MAERYRINRALILLPIAAVIAAAGVEWMWQRRARVWRWAVIALIAAMPLQFAAFYRDYFGDYRVRSYAWFEYNMRGGMAGDHRSRRRRQHGVDFAEPAMGRLLLAVLSGSVWTS